MILKLSNVFGLRVAVVGLTDPPPRTFPPRFEAAAQPVAVPPPVVSVAPSASEGDTKEDTQEEAMEEEKEETTTGGAAEVRPERWQASEDCTRGEPRVIE